MNVLIHTLIDGYAHPYIDIYVPITIEQWSDPYMSERMYASVLVNVL
jgi:hypothetical protein